MVHFGDFLKTWSLRSNSGTRQVSFNRTKIGGKCQNSKIQMRHIESFSNNVKNIGHSNQIRSIRGDIFGLIFKQCVSICSCQKKDIFIHVVLLRSPYHPALYVCLCRYVYNQWCQQTIGAWTVLWYDGHHYLCCNKCCLTIKLLHFSVLQKTNRSSNFRWELEIHLQFLRVAILCICGPRFSLHAPF